MHFTKKNKCCSKFFQLFLSITTIQIILVIWIPQVFCLFTFHRRGSSSLTPSFVFEFFQMCHAIWLISSKAVYLFRRLIPFLHAFTSVYSLPFGSAYWFPSIKSFIFFGDFSYFFTPIFYFHLTFLFSFRCYYTVLGYNSCHPISYFIKYILSVNLESIV